MKNTHFVDWSIPTPQERDAARKQAGKIRRNRKNRQAKNETQCAIPWDAPDGKPLDCDRLKLGKGKIAFWSKT